LKSDYYIIIIKIRLTHMFWYVSQRRNTYKWEEIGYWKLVRINGSCL